MKCPVDGENLVLTERLGVEIDYCPKCRGVWLDRGELDKIIRRDTIVTEPDPRDYQQPPPPRQPDPRPDPAHYAPPPPPYPSHPDPRAQYHPDDRRRRDRDDDWDDDDYRERERYKGKRRKKNSAFDLFEELFDF